MFFFGVGRGRDLIYGFVVCCVERWVDMLGLFNVGCVFCFALISITVRVVHVDDLSV